MSKTISAWLLAAMLLAVALSGSASAGQSTITMNQRGQALELGSQVTFAVSTARTDHPWVSVACFQSGRLVYKQYHGLFAGYYTDPVFTLGPTPNWTGGSASCVGTLLYFANGREHSLATTSFAAQ